MAKYILIEGSEGAGKSTQINKLAEYLEDKGYKVLKTREPGSPHLPLTMIQRNLMLDNQYSSQMSLLGRELLSQSIRSNHLVKLIKPALDEYDFIIQDRGILSGLAYGEACGNDRGFIESLANNIVKEIGKTPETLYDLVLYFDVDADAGLKNATSSKQEFESGDAMESKGGDFLRAVQSNFNRILKGYPHQVINVDMNKEKAEGINQTFNKILETLKKRNIL